MANTNRSTQEEKLNNIRRKLNFGEPDKDEPSKEEFSRRIKEELLKDMENVREYTRNLIYSFCNNFFSY